MNAATEFEPNTQPRRDVHRMAVMGYVITATVTYGEDGRPNHVRYATPDTLPENIAAYLTQFNDLVNLQLAEGWDYDRIEAFVREHGVFFIVEPMIDVLRVAA